MGWPEYTWIVLVAISWLGQVGNHGRPREPYNGYEATANVLIAGILLYAGGFFS